MQTYTLHQGTAPLLISMPHVGTVLPPELAQRMQPVAQQLDDTDWHLEQLYDFARDMGASILVPTYSRYVIDLNRPRDNANLYPGQDTTGLCPIDTFAKQPLYAAGNEPDDAEIAARVPIYWQPYHTALSHELARIKAQHGRALLWEAHSICSEVPRFFTGRLPDFNLGTANGAACSAGLGEALLAAAQSQSGYSAVLNGRFKGGHITRHYGQPAHGIDAVQLELSQCTYMQESHPYDYQPAQAQQVQPLLRQLLQTLLDFKAD
ncbi:N-formylglutamate deformylase [Chitinimonas sp. BJB300]|uniref:N-formylglutamate deformylase n=1 Tax=Chitinimonas sp. BJB300 TaxID=1559339 RepID=UPI000C0D0D1E|nr:N-formylglutamate deformylase [Chitinimonas sp. BJB300]PHV13484.1 N-formylglutamate deformylase [Chitinimonas sp. BJB300]TSJ89831.1 N-formylglutamate deformylase [Chitinimonas sp. BJB300]